MDSNAHMTFSILISVQPVRGNLDFFNALHLSISSYEFEFVAIGLWS